MRRLPPLYPYLLVILPVASDYQTNVGEQYFEEFLSACGILLLATVVVVLVARLAVRNFRQAAVLAAVFLAGFLFYMRVFDSIEALPAVGAILAPHPPYVLRSDGSFPDEAEVSSLGEATSFRNEVIALNHMVITLIDRILTDSSVPPVIILQADEGPYPTTALSAGSEPQPIDVQRAYHQEKTGILNAYYLPGGETTALHPEITPVNTFRLVFNLYFGAKLPILPDRIYAHLYRENPYRLTDVTQLVSEK
jgi:hypothetical protein